MDLSSAYFRRVRWRFVHADPEMPDDVRAYACSHGRLRGDERCLGCGRTRNEITLEDRR